MSDLTPCEKCGRPHARCAAHRRDGAPCGQPAMRGQRVCKMHGGKKAQARANGEARYALEVERKRARLLGAPREVHPAVALLEAVSWTAGEVDYWRGRVRELDEDALTWSRAEHREGQGPEGPVDVDTHRAARNVVYDELVAAQDRLVRYAAAALKAGVEERRVQLAEQQGQAVAQVLRDVLAELGLSAEQEAVAARVIPGRLRALGEGA